MNKISKISVVFLLAICAIAIGCGGGSKDSASQPSQPVLSSIRISPTDASVPIGMTQIISTVGVYSDGSTKSISAGLVTWHSSDASVATVDEIGVVRAIRKGSATITAAYSGFTASAAMSTADPVVTAIMVDPPTPSLAANTRQQFTARGSYSDDSGRDLSDEVTWKSSAPSVATVDVHGLVTSLTAGTATITAKMGSVEAVANVTVTGVSLTTIAVVPYQPVLGIGVRDRFVALGAFNDGAGHVTVAELASVAWSSNAPTIASIDETGIVTTLASGTTRISATSGEISGGTDLTVTPAALRSITLTPVAPSMAVLTSRTLTATGTFSDGSTRELSLLNWSSEDSKIATVDTDGMIQGVAAGSTKITATSGTVSGSVTLTVTNATLSEVAVAPAAAVIPIYASKQFYATGIFSDGSTQDLTHIVKWSSTVSSVAKINKAGLASGDVVGTTTIKAVVPSTLASVEPGATQLKVSSLHVDSATVLPENPVIPKGTKQQFTLVGNLNDGTVQPIEGVSWISYAIGVSTIDANGVATGRESGSSWIYGEGCCKTAKTTLRVNPVKLTSLAISRTTEDPTPIGAAEQFKAIGTFADGTVMDITNAVYWTTSSRSIAVIDELGKATGIGSGEVMITATFGPVSGDTKTVSASAELDVSSATLASISVTPGSASVPLGQTKQFTAVGSFTDGSLHELPALTWTCSNPHIALIHPSGMMLTVGKGSATVTANSGAVQGSASLVIE